jgi:hypothetical protein
MLLRRMFGNMERITFAILKSLETEVYLKAMVFIYHSWLTISCLISCTEALGIKSMVEAMSFPKNDSFYYM